MCIVKHCFKYLLAIFLFAVNTNLFCQIDDREAEEHFKHKNYVMAIPVYKNLLKLERDHAT